MTKARVYILERYRKISEVILLTSLTQFRKVIFLNSTLIIEFMPLIF